MRESKVNPDQYIVLQGWMISELRLKGNELILYACIYGFSQAENQVFNGSLQYLADWTNSTKQGVIRCLKSLVEKGLITKTEKLLNGVKFCEYQAIKLNRVCNKVEQGMQQSLTPPIQQSLPNNLDTDNLSNNLNDRDIETRKTDCQQVVDLFNSICVSFPSVRSLNEARKKAIKARLTNYTMDDFRTVFENAETSTFLKGGNDRGWSANFDWIIKDANMAKVLEGNYADRKPTRTETVPSWIKPRELDADEQAAVQRMMAAQDEPPAADPEFEERKERLQQRLREKYGKGK